MKLNVSEAQGNNDWDIENDVVTEEDLKQAEKSGAKSLMEGAKDGNLPEIQIKKKVRDAYNCFQ